MAEGRAALDVSIATMLAHLATVGGCRDDVVKLIYLITDLQLRDAVDPHVICLWAGATGGPSDAMIAGPSRTVGTPEALGDERRRGGYAPARPSWVGVWVVPARQCGRLAPRGLVELGRHGFVTHQA